MSQVIIYVTTASENEALRLGRLLVGEELAACANVMAHVTSVFRWEGEIRQEAEAVLLLKTRRDLVERATRRIIDAHDYDCPCVVALPIEGGNPAFLDWIDSETMKTA